MHARAEKREQQTVMMKDDDFTQNRRLIVLIGEKVNIKDVSGLLREQKQHEDTHCRSTERCGEQPA